MTDKETDKGKDKPKVNIVLQVRNSVSTVGSWIGRKPEKERIATSHRPWS